MHRTTANMITCGRFPCCRPGCKSIFCSPLFRPSNATYVSHSSSAVCSLLHAVKCVAAPRSLSPSLRKNTHHFPVKTGHRLSIYLNSPRLRSPTPARCDVGSPHSPSGLATSGAFFTMRLNVVRAFFCDHRLNTDLVQRPLGFSLGPRYSHTPVLLARPPPPSRSRAHVRRCTRSTKSTNLPLILALRTVGPHCMQDLFGPCMYARCASALRNTNMHLSQSASCLVRDYAENAGMPVYR